VLHAVAIVLVVALATLIAVLIWVELDSVTYGRVLGATAVAAVLATLLQPILRRMEAPPPSGVQLVLRLDREAPEEAVAAAIEALARHGVRAERS
jgi:membrane protein implicated in regulation of membrane protease activity